MKRYDIINELIFKYNYERYLEIGTQFGECFTNIKAKHKICVDPEKRFEHLTHHMTSDEFFDKNTEQFDVVFVDGLHLEQQSSKDIQNSLKVLSPNGTVVVHDCLPHCEEFIQVCWNGTVFRSIIELRYNNPELNICVVNTDNGCGLISKRAPLQIPYSVVSLEEAKQYSYFERNKQELMNVISVNEFLSQMRS